MTGLLAFMGPVVSGYLVGRYGLVPGMRAVYAVVFVCVMAITGIRWRYLEETVDGGGGLERRELAASFSESVGSIVEA